MDSGLGLDLIKTRPKIEDPVLLSTHTFSWGVAWLGKNISDCFG